MRGCHRMTSTIAGRGARRPPLLGALGALAMLACSTAPPALEPTAAPARTRRVALCPHPGELVQVELCHATTAGAQAVLDLDLWCGERTGGTWFLRGDAGLGSACSGAHSSPIGGVLLGVARPGALASLADEYQPYWGRPLVLTPRLRGAPSFADDRLRVEEILGDVRLQDPSNQFELTMLPAADGSVLVTKARDPRELGVAPRPGPHRRRARDGARDRHVAGRHPRPAAVVPPLVASSARGRPAVDRGAPPGPRAL